MNKSLSGKIFDTFNVMFFALLGLVMLFPFWNVLMTSIVSAGEYYSTPVMLFPKKINLDAYRFIFSTGTIPNAFLISVIVTVGGVVYNMFLITTASYGLSKKGMPGRNGLLMFFLVTMYFSGGVVPYYIILTKYLHYTDMIWAMFLNAGLPVGLFIILKNFFNEIPDSIPEAAKIDGANEFYILLRIIIPLSLPAMATLTLFLSVSYWNSWYDAMIFINKPNLKPLQLALRELLGLGSRQMGYQQSAVYMDMLASYKVKTGNSNPNVFEDAIRMATLVVTVVPIICVYPFLQKYFEKGVMIGSLKE